jgi:uncharacterized protein YggE
MRPSMVAVLSVILFAAALPVRADAPRPRKSSTMQSEIGAPTPHREAEAARRVIEVTGYATVSAKPDDMIVSFSVNSRAPAADECTREQSAKTNKIVDTLKAKAGAAAQIHTADFSMSPYSVPITGTATATPSAGPPSQPAQNWVFTAQVTAFADSLITISKVIDAAMAAGAAAVGGSGFRIEPPQTATARSGAAESAIRGNQTFVSGATSQGYVPRAPKPYITMMIKISCSGASECVRQGARRVDRIKRAMMDTLGGTGSVQLSDYEVDQVEPARGYRYQPARQYPMRQEFQAHATVLVETRDLQKLGELIEAGISAGADQLNSVQFTLRDDAAARDQAIAKAAQDAKSKAAVLAKSMGVQLGDVMRISTNASVQPRTIYGPSLAASFHRAEARPMPVQPHEVGFSAQVIVTYAIK